MFIDNLPPSMTNGWLEQLFGHERWIIDIFMSRKKRRISSSPFAFVRYARRGGAVRVI